MNDVNSPKNTMSSGKTVRTIKFVAIAIALTATAGTLYAWSAPPSATPPTCPAGSVGCDAPLNVSNTLQSKDGNLLLNAGGTFATGLAVPFGNVGIGTVAPSTKLHVIGTIATESVNPRFTLESSDPNTARRNSDIVGTGAAALWRFYKEVKGSDPTLVYLTIDSGGKINTAGDVNVPTGKCFMVNNVCIGSGGVTISGGGAGTTNYLPKWDITGSALTKTSLVFDNGANVGIGTAVPSAGATLDVNGHIAISSADPYFRTDTDSKWIVLSGGSGWASTGAVMVLRGATTATNPSGFELYAGNAERMRINAAGNVGIGTPAPLDKLHVAGNIVQDNTNILGARNAGGAMEPWMWPRWSDNIMYTNFGAAGWQIRNNASSPVMFMAPGGNIGIGTASPAGKLHVSGSFYTNTGEIVMLPQDGVNEGGQITLARAGAWNDLVFDNYVGSPRIYVSSSIASDKQLQVFNAGGGAGKLGMYVEGNVGIGTAAAGYKLTVASGAIGGNYGLAPNYAAWASYGVGDGGAGVYNDNGTYKALMVVGNNSAGGGRNVSVWDNLLVNGDVNIVGCYRVAGVCIGSGTTGGSGTANYVTKWTNPTTIGNSQIFDNGTNVGVGTTLPNGKLDVYTSGANGDGAVFAPGITMDNNFTIQSYIDTAAGGGGWAGRTTYASGCCNNLALQPDVGTVTVGMVSGNSPYKLDVNGTVNATQFYIKGTPSLYGNANDNYANIRVLQNISATLQDGMYINYNSTGAAGAKPARIFDGSTANPVIVGTGGSLTVPGNVGIGVPVPTQKLDVAGNINASGGLTTTGSINTVGGNISGYRLFSSDLAQFGGGVMEAGLWSPGVGYLQFSYGQIYLLGSATGFAITDNTATPVVGWVTNGPTKGNMTNVGSITAPAFYYSSDRVLKKDIKTIPNALDSVLKLRGVEFNWKKDNIPSVGVIAQEVEKVYPQLVETNPTTGLKSVQYGNLVGPLIESVKELKAENDELRARIEKLEAKN